MKTVFFLLAVALSCTYSHQAQAVNCPADAYEIEQMISSAGSCYEAVKIANECAWGSSVDVGLAGAASDICLKNYAQWSNKHKMVLATLAEDCDAKYAGQQGTMYLSMNAFCKLGVIQVISDLNEEVL